MLFYTQQLRMQIQSAEHWRWKSKILSLWVLSLMAHFWMSGKTLTLTGPCFSRTVHRQWWPLSCSKNARRHRIICFADEAFCSCTWNVWTSESMNNKCVYIIIYIIIYVYIYICIYIYMYNYDILIHQYLYLILLPINCYIYIYYRYLILHLSLTRPILVAERPTMRTARALPPWVRAIRCSSARPGSDHGGPGLDEIT